MAPDGRLEELAAELDSVAESLTEHAMDALRSALADLGPEASREAKATERRLNRARAAVERAARLIRLEAAGEELA
jgi:hypothetical protein